MTKIIKLGRGKGKTTEAIKLASKGFHYIVCCDSRQAHSVHGQAREMGLDIPLPITFDTFSRGDFHAPGIKGFIIDDIDWLFNQWLGRRLKGRELIGVTHSDKLNFIEEEKQTK